VFCQPWQQDLTFDDDGIVITDIDDGNNRVFGIVPQSNGEIIAVGNALSGENYEICLVKYHSNGSLDLSFGDGGIIIDNSTERKNYVKSVVTQADGKFIVCGQETMGYYLDVFLSRYKENGDNDLSFGNSGYASLDLGSDFDDFTAMAIQPDGKIVVVGQTYEGDIRIGVVARFNSDGSLDESFGDLGLLHLSTAVGGDLLMNVKLQNDGKIVITGFSYNEAGDSDFICFRLLGNGNWDNTFNGDGIFTYDYGDYEYAESIFIQADGKIVLGGFTSPTAWNHTLIIRILENGTIDNTFGTDGVFYLTQSRCNALIGTESNIIVGSTNYIEIAKSDFSLYALNMEGKIDTSFCADNFINTDLGSFTETPSCMLFQDNYTILMAGGTGNTANFGIVRYKTSATPISENFDLSENKLLLYPNPVTDECTLITNEKFEDGFIVDACGKTVAQIKLINQGNNYTIKIPAGIANGNYFLVLKNKTQYTTIPFVK